MALGRKLARCVWPLLTLAGLVAGAFPDDLPKSDRYGGVKQRVAEPT